MIRSHPLQAADGDGLLLDAATPARRLAGAIADPAENAREYVGFTIDHVGLRELALGDEPDVFGNVGMSRTGPLTIDDTMIVVRIPGIGRFHRYSSPLIKHGAMSMNIAAEEFKHQTSLYLMTEQKKRSVLKLLS